jgi:hypothetical protein
MEMEEKEIQTRILMTIACARPTRAAPARAGASTRRTTRASPGQSPRAYTAGAARRITGFAGAARTLASGRAFAIAQGALTAAITILASTGTSARTTFATAGH